MLTSLLLKALFTFIGLVFVSAYIVEEVRDWRRGNLSESAKSDLRDALKLGAGAALAFVALGAFIAVSS